MTTARNLIVSLALLTFVLLLFSDRASSKRLIFISFPISSHAYKHVTLARALGVKGYDVWLVLHSSVLGKGFVDVRGRGVHVIEYNTSVSMDDDFAVDLFLRPFLARQEVPWDKVGEMVTAFTEDMFRNVTLFQEMKNVNADLFVLDSDLAVAKMYAVFPYRMDVPFALLDYSFQPFYRRIPFSPATTPLFFSSLGPDMKFRERVENTLAYVMSYLSMPGPMLYQDAVARFAPEKPYMSLDQLEARAEVWLVQSDHLFFFPEPTLPNVKHIGGLAASPATQPLPKEFQTFMDTAPDGVVVVSFGSLVLDFPDNLTSKIMTAFLQLKPIKFVMQSNAPSPDPQYIMTSSWLPQNALLAHANCRVFVTHCGLSGQYQAMYHAVPMLGLPMFYDQPYNANVMQRKGFGVVLDILEASVEDLVNAIEELTNNATYKASLSRASALFRELYDVPVTSAVYWLEHVMEHGGGHMRSAGQRMPLYQFLLLDVLAFLASVTAFVMVAFCCCARIVYKCVRGCVGSEQQRVKSKKE